MSGNKKVDFNTTLPAIPVGKAPVIFQSVTIDEQNAKISAYIDPVAAGEVTKTYVDDQDAATLAAAEAYTDGHSGASGFADLDSGTNVDAAMVVGTGASLTRSGSGHIDADKVAGATYGAPGAEGTIPIAQPDGSVLFADPMVQGLVDEGASVAAIKPVIVGGRDGSNNAKSLVLDASGRPTVNIAGTVPLPTGAAQDGTDGSAPPAVLGSGTGIRGWLRSIYEKLTGSIAVTGTFWQATQPVSLAANQSVNVAQMNGVAVTMGAGNSGTGVQRVVIATDQTVLTNSLKVTQTPATAGGLTPASGSIQATATAIKASAGQLFGLQFYNPNIVPVWYQIFNTATGSVTLGTTVPILSFGVAAGASSNIPFGDNGIEFTTAITIAVTTTRTGNVAAALAADYNAQYK